MLYKNDTLEYDISGLAVGTSIIILSMLLNSKKSIVLNAPSNYTVIRDLKRIFNISDSQLRIETKETLNNDIWSRCADRGKFFSPYITADTINLFGQQHIVGKKNKPCIGLATWDLQHEFAHKAFPYNRLYSKEYWAEIFKLIQSTGYDVITFNIQDVSLEQKIWMMNELCDCVIGYEGGMCHLAHCLKIPNIILPWLRNADGTLGPDDLYRASHRYHLDIKTYFLKSGDELLSYHKDQLKSLITSLHENQGNNLYWQHNVQVDPLTLQLKSTTLPNGDLHPSITKFEQDFILNYIQNPSVGGKLS
jgi:hypothetical protein